MTIVLQDGKLIELKNVDYTSASIDCETQDQVIFGAFANILSIDEYEWSAHLKKLIANGWTEDEAIPNLKAKWQKAFQADPNKVFTAMNPALKASLFGTNNPTIQRLRFDDMFDGKNSDLYKFRGCPRSRRTR